MGLRKKNHKILSHRSPHAIPEQRTMNQGLWLLTNQLYRPSCKSVTPTLCFGFAVDGGGGSGENILPFFRSIPKKCHCGQVGALKEGPIPDAGNAIRNRDARQAFAATEGRTPDAGELTVRPESDAGQARAAR